MEKKELRKITREELYEVLKNHERWLTTDGKEGERADLRFTDLSVFDLVNANLKGADLSCACLNCANLEGANLSHADLFFAELSGADLHGANLTCADLEGVDLGAANFAKINLSNVKNLNIPLACPSEGSFIGWKTACCYIIKLEIPEDAKRSSGISTMCRCNKAKVLAIENKDGTPTDVTEVHSDYDKNFIYKVGETVSVDDFDNNRFNECTHGIHFYMDRDSAASYY